MLKSEFSNGSPVATRRLPVAMTRAFGTGRSRIVTHAKSVGKLTVRYSRCRDFSSGHFVSSRSTCKRITLPLPDRNPRLGLKFTGHFCEGRFNAHYLWMRRRRNGLHFGRPGATMAWNRRESDEAPDASPVAESNRPASPMSDDE